MQVKVSTRQDESFSPAPAPPLLLSPHNSSLFHCHHQGEDRTGQEKEKEEEEKLVTHSEKQIAILLH